jgi:hypothetical protein
MPWSDVAMLYSFNRELRMKKQNDATDSATTLEDSTTREEVVTVAECYYLQDCILIRGETCPSPSILPIRKLYFR